MSEVVRIDPLYEQPGLIAYECNDCHYVTSEIVPAENGRGPAPFYTTLTMRSGGRLARVHVEGRRTRPGKPPSAKYVSENCPVGSVPDQLTRGCCFCPQQADQRMRRDRTLVTPTCHQRNHGSASMTKHTVAFAIALARCRGLTLSPV